MMHRAWSSIVEVPYCFSRSYVKFQGHTALKIVEFDPNWAFPDCNSSLNSPMAMKCCTKLETAKERCPFVFQGHPSNFKVTRYKTSPILTQIGRFRTIGRSPPSNPSDLPCWFRIKIFTWNTGHFFTKKPAHDDLYAFWRTEIPKWSWELNDIKVVLGEQKIFFRQPAPHQSLGFCRARLIHDVCAAWTSSSVSL